MNVSNSVFDRNLWPYPSDLILASTARIIVCSRVIMLYIAWEGSAR